MLPNLLPFSFWLSAFSLPRTARSTLCHFGTVAQLWHSFHGKTNENCAMFVFGTVIALLICRIKKVIE
jgi:hypothetical protein